METESSGATSVVSIQNTALPVKPTLISFCNLPVLRATAIFRLDTSSGELSEIGLGFSRSVEGCTGMTSDDARVYVLCVSEGIYHLSVLTKDELEYVFCEPLPEVKDGHSILVKDQQLYVVSTGTDEVIRYDLAAEGAINPRAVWRASPCGSDTHHVNSIADWNGNLVVSAFGPKFGTLWTSALEGYIHDISRDVRIKSGIYHPHSLSVRGDDLYYLESHRKLFCSLDGAIFSLTGYPRGVCWLSDDVVCLGSNVGRRVSKSTGLIANPADPGEASGSCGVTVVHIKTGRRLKHLDLGRVGGEVYDLMVND
jgi:uncharacterized protein DUF4915